MSRVIDALNKIGNEPWAYLLIVSGSALWMYCAHLHLDTNTASGIIGAGLALFQSAAKQNLNITAPNASTQNVTAPPNPTQPQS